MSVYDLGIYDDGAYDDEAPLPLPHFSTTKENLMAQLLEPDGTENITLPAADAIEYCRTHPGWSWRYVGE